MALLFTAQPGAFRSAGRCPDSGCNLGALAYFSGLLLLHNAGQRNRYDRIADHYLRDHRHLFCMGLYENE